MTVVQEIDKNEAFLIDSSESEENDQDVVKEVDEEQEEDNEDDAEMRLIKAQKTTDVMTDDQRKNFVSARY